MTGKKKKSYTSNQCKNSYNIDCYVEINYSESIMRINTDSTIKAFTCVRGYSKAKVDWKLKTVFKPITDFLGVD